MVRGVAGFELAIVGSYGLLASLSVPRSARWISRRVIGPFMNDIA